MEGLLPRFALVIYFDYYAHNVNVVISIIGVILNFFHFSILIQKSLRSIPVFIIMLVICICDLLQLFVLILDDLKYITEFSNACLGSNTYPGAIYTIVADIISRHSSFISTWVAVVMAVFRSVSIKLPMSSLSTVLSKSSTARFMILLVFIVATTYITFNVYLKYDLVLSRPDFPCLYTDRLPKEQRYVMYGTLDAQYYNYFFTMIEGYIQLTQLILFAISTFFLTSSVNKAKKTRALMSKNDMESAQTEWLIVFMMGSFFLAIFPLMLANLTLEMFISNFSPFALKMTITVMLILQTLNACSHGIICLLMSSQYRDVAKQMYFPRKSVMVEPSQIFSVVRK